MEAFNHRHKVLFILHKRNQTWGQTNPHHYHSSGLLNSVTFLCQMLNRAGVEAKLVEVHDSNSIDREVFNFNPSVVILEAIWCPPYKLRELTSLHRHRHRHWIVRNHSELPFLALEGVSLQWLLECAAIKNVHISCNSHVANKEIEEMVNLRAGNHHHWYDTLVELVGIENRKHVWYLPNYYPTHTAISKKHCENSCGSKCSCHTIDIGCFGAIRPLKNHVQQAVAAIIYASGKNKKLRFHINATRMENKGEPILKSIRGLFEGLPHAELVEHQWMTHAEFLELSGKMDINLQVSFSETFNIVAADSVLQGVPVIGSNEIPWLPEEFHADPTSAFDISEKMLLLESDDARHELHALKEYSEESKKLWLHRLSELK